MAPAIRDSRSLNTIILRSNNLGVEGAKALAPAIRDSRSLTQVHPIYFRMCTNSHFLNDRNVRC